MRPNEVLREARTRAGLTQRELAGRTGIAQPTIARIERGLAEPRIGTFERLLAACGSTLAVEPKPGFGVDRTQIRELRKLTPAQRLETLRRDVQALATLDRAVRR